MKVNQLVMLKHAIFQLDSSIEVFKRLNMIRPEVKFRLSKFQPYFFCIYILQELLVRD